MSDIFSRTQMLIGKNAMEKLSLSRVIVFGTGGVGGFTVEALARSGIGALDLVDNDTVSLSNINRQIVALQSTVGKYKVDVMAERIHDINPECRVTVHKCFFLPETANQFDFSKYDYVIDAVDTVAAKLEIIRSAKEAGIKIISCMGAGNKLNPSLFKIDDISKTSVCPLARVVRLELRKRGIKDVKVLYSTEKPAVQSVDSELNAGIDAALSVSKEPVSCVKTTGRSVPASISFVPSVAGLLIAREVILDLAGK